KKRDNSRLRREPLAAWPTSRVEILRRALREHPLKERKHLAAVCVRQMLDAVRAVLLLYPARQLLLGLTKRAARGANLVRQARIVRSGGRFARDRDQRTARLFACGKLFAHVRPLVRLWIAEFGLRIDES